MYVIDQFEHQPWEYTGIDLDEEEEDFEDEEDDLTIPGGGRKNFGETRHYCPVTLKERNILHPGAPDTAVRFREHTYFFISNDARTQFLDNPNLFLSNGKPLQPPPLRICIIGPRGSGKTFYGRTLSKQLGIFHITFRERLQELIITKTQKRIVDELEEELQDDISEHDNANAEANNARGGIIEEEGEEEDDELELDEDEDAIRAYLADDEPIPDETLDKVIQPWWDEDPFRKKGFILEGFPRTSNQVRYMAQAGFYPDIIIILSVDDSDVMDRLLPPLMERWQTKRNKRIEKREKEKERLRKLKAERAARQAEREERLQRKREDGDSDISDSEEEDEDEEDEEDVDALLEEELGEEEEEEEEEEEAEDDARDRLKAVLLERYDDDMNRLSLVQEAMEEVWMPKSEVTSGRKPHIVRYLLNKLLKPYTENRTSLLEKCHPVDFRLSRQIIETGYKQSSQFGWWCPVKLFDKEVVQPLHGPGVSTYPVVHRSHVYYLSSEDARQRFIDNPLKYIHQSPPGPVIPFQIAIVGPPKSGKTTLANRFVADYGVLRLSMGEAIRLVLEKQSTSTLAKEINEYLYVGQTVPDALGIQALENALLNVTCQTRGFVLDGFPSTKKQVELMNERKILPVKIIELDVEDKELKRRAAMDRRSKDRVLPLHDSSRIFSLRLKYWRKVVIPVKQWYHKRHFNWYPINGQASKWLVWNTASEIAIKSIQQIQIYTERISKGLAAPIANLCITPEECEARLGEYRHYCPVSLVNRGELRDCYSDNQLIYGAEFRGRYYKMADEETLQEFLNNTEQFLAPQSPVNLPLPHLLPIKRTPAEVKAKFPMEIELKGYCPVTYLEGHQRYESIIPGKTELLAEFDGKIYSFESEDKLEKFMRLPNKYHGLTLPKKLPPRLDPINVTGLPILGYLEQSLAEITVKSLTAVGSFKPKHPFLDAHQSAHIYMAYFLKANNPRNNEYIRKKYRDKLRKFEENCELITYLSEKMTVHYKEPTERPIDFDHKMQNFLSMKEEVM
ncbi:uncharacterized protein TRIADDRAFT_30390 [Trichoplax adhaerens]|uniref:Adenylate kinase 9 n=1 Tax=Trichoplax adhaerens TaxID=10228 RepID=B3S727_TRIAD|nr:hypothetical protein TRIADDRAFT_30390 [Trichoplax adhaerens]EDV21496.1 hypothetical protein TRIADDRAFT_30390 [Trichoplax adhaerens]|eukprot:XP_002116096.1 hypothetical protein TRIADDRAFT_30390 [Trichoplax adhaerens]